MGMNSEPSRQTISVASINLAPHEEEIVKSALDNANSRGDGPCPYILRDKNNAKGAEVLIARLETPDFNRTSQLLKKVYGVKSTIFVVNNPPEEEQTEYKYLVKGENLIHEFPPVLDTLSRDELRDPTEVRREFAPAPPVEQAEPDGQTVGRVLVVDDSPSVRTQMEQFLTKRGFKCHMAENAEQGIEAIRANGFDAVFLDVIMPGADGYQLCKAIKALEHARGVPVILLTSKNSPIDRIHGIMSGCDKYLTKPVRASELDQLLHSYFPAFKPAATAKS
jgi:CheY-like chemotaxis protein